MKDKSRLVTVRVPVPQDQLGEFYLMLGEFFDGDTDKRTLSRKGGQGEASAPGAEPKYKPWTGPEAVEAATLYWKKKLNRRGRAMLSELANHPGQRFTGEQIAELLGLDSSRQVAGVLAWPGRYAYEMGYELPTSWAWSDEDDPGGYYMSPEVAAVFREAESQAAE